MWLYNLTATTTLEQKLTLVRKFFVVKLFELRQYQSHYCNAIFKKPFYNHMVIVVLCHNSAFKKHILTNDSIVFLIKNPKRNHEEL